MQWSSYLRIRESPPDLPLEHQPYLHSAAPIGAVVFPAHATSRVASADRPGVLDHQQAQTGVGLSHVYRSPLYRQRGIAGLQDAGTMTMELRSVGSIVIRGGRSSYAVVRVTTNTWRRRPLILLP